MNRKQKAEDAKTSSESKANVADKKSDSQTEGEPEGEGSKQAAFNPDTGEINWDCPCLEVWPMVHVVKNSRKPFPVLYFLKLNQRN